jgi:hypothetical protein
LVDRPHEDLNVVGDNTRLAIADAHDDTSTTSRDIDDTPETELEPETSSSLDRAHVDRVSRSLLEQEFGLQLGLSEPPLDVTEAVRRCLHEVSLSIQGARSLGLITQSNFDTPSPEAAGSASFNSSARGSTTGTSASNGRKRAMRNIEEEEDDIQEDPDQGRGAVAQTDGGYRKKPKIERYPCPFRKKNPYKFNCREWEFCAKAPFKTISDLK